MSERPPPAQSAGGSLPSFEQEIKAYLGRARLRFTDHTASFKQPDFTLYLPDGALFFLEVKEKRQPYNMRNWPPFAPETDLFILDDLTVRKCLGYAPRAGILVRDNRQHHYIFFSVIDLALMPRLRVNRPIQRNRPDEKGKWLVNLQNGARTTTLDLLFRQIVQYVADLPAILSDYHPCFGNYVGEEIGTGGITRNPGHWDADVGATR